VNPCVYLARARDARAEPRDEQDEDAGQEDLGGVERGLHAGHPETHLPDLL